SPLALHSFPTRRSSDLCRQFPLIFQCREIRKNSRLQTGKISGTEGGGFIDAGLIHRQRQNIRQELIHPVVCHHAAINAHPFRRRSEEHTSELQSRENLV